jgi:hypothetical protein
MLAGHNLHSFDKASQSVSFKSIRFCPVFVQHSFEVSDNSEACEGLGLVISNFRSIRHLGTAGFELS